MGKKTTIWDLIDAFYRARALFMDIYEAYEDGVLQHAKERGIDRKELRLDAKGISALLDMKTLSDLRDDHLLPLKEIAHDLFRSDDATDLFDRYVHDVFHEISILKEEHLKVYSFAPENAHLEEEEEYAAIMEEVHELFPHKVHHVHSLFGKAKGRLEQILPAFGEDRVLIRSLFLFGDELLGNVYEGGLAGFYKYLYPEHGAIEGYCKVGKSFLASGFLEKAREAFEECIATGEKSEPKTPEIEQIIKDAREGLAKARKAPEPQPR